MNNPGFGSFETGWIIETQREVAINPGLTLGPGVAGRVVNVQKYGIELELYQSHDVIFVEYGTAWSGAFERLLCHVCEDWASQLYHGIPTCDKHLDIAIDTVADRD